MHSLDQCEVRDLERCVGGIWFSISLGWHAIRHTKDGLVDWEEDGVSCC